MGEIGSEFWEKTKYQNDLNADNKKGKIKPHLELEYSSASPIIELPKPEDMEIGFSDLRETLEKRTSVRKYSEDPLTLTELSYLLWCTQGVKEVIPAVTTFRTVPSAGACHALETFLQINRVEGLKAGIYRFLAIKHSLIPIKLGEEYRDQVVAACLDQNFLKDAAAVFFWAAIKERMTWRYGERGYRYLLLDAGHVCQNLYLSALSLQCGVCAIAAFFDDALNPIFGLDGHHEFVVYGASLGKRK